MPPPTIGDAAALAKKEAAMQEERLIDIEIKLTRQEDMLEALNQVVYSQQKKIDELQTWCAALAAHIGNRAGQDAELRPLDERPPHY